MKELDISRLVFLDEMSICTAMHETTGWSPIGEELIVECPRYGSRKTVVGAITAEQPLVGTPIDGALNGEKFIAWIWEDLGPVLPENALVVMDNLRVHGVEGVEEALAAFGAKALFLPAYTPEFNPIELCWAYIKRILRHNPRRSMEGLLEAFDLAWKFVDRDLCSGWVRHCGYSSGKLDC